MDTTQASRACVPAIVGEWQLLYRPEKTGCYVNDHYALRTSGNAPLNPPWGATESPFVVKYAGFYYLFVTYTDSRPDNYHNTLVFRSSDPLDFGVYNGDNQAEVVVARLHAHAPEVVYDDVTASWYITTCGWRNHGIPIEGAVAIARLDWQPESRMDGEYNYV